MGWFSRKPKQEVTVAPLAGDGSYRWQAVGESYYVEALKRLISAAPVEDRDKGEVRKTAILAPEPTNQYDKRAIAILIDGVKVGHVSKTDLDTIHRAASSRPVPVQAVIVWNALNPDAPIGVRYDYTVPNVPVQALNRPKPGSFRGRPVQLKRGTQIALVDVDPGFVDRVRASVPKQPRIGHVVEVACAIDAKGDVWAYSDGVTVGRISPDMLNLYGPEFSRLHRGNCYGITDCYIKPDGAKSPHALSLEYAREGIT